MSNRMTGIIAALILILLVGCDRSKEQQNIQAKELLKSDQERLSKLEDDATEQGKQHVAIKGIARKENTPQEIQALDKALTENNSEIATAIDAQKKRVDDSQQRVDDLRAKIRR